MLHVVLSLIVLNAVSLVACDSYVAEMRANVCLHFSGCSDGFLKKKTQYGCVRVSVS